MHNHVVLTGRLTGTPELRQTASGVLVCRFGIAVQRKYNKNTNDNNIQDTPTAQDIPDNVDLADFETLTDDSNTPF